MGVVDNEFRASEFRVASARCHRFEVRLADDVGRAGIILHPVGMHIEHQNAVSISHKQTLMGMIVCQTRFGATCAVGPIDLGLPATAQQTAMPDHMICRMADMAAFVVQLVNQYTNISWLRYKHPVMDAV